MLFPDVADDAGDHDADVVMISKRACCHDDCGGEGA